MRRSPSPYRGTTTSTAVYCAPPVIAGSVQAGPGTGTLRNTRPRAGAGAATRTRGYSDEDEEVSFYMTDPLVGEVLNTFKIIHEFNCYVFISFLG